MPRCSIRCVLLACGMALACGAMADDERPPLPESWEQSLTDGFPGLPPDAREVAERAAGCLYFSGEFNGDGGERDRQVAASMDRLACRRIDSDIASMRARYPDDAYVQRALDLVAEAR